MQILDNETRASTALRFSGQINLYCTRHPAMATEFSLYLYGGSSTEADFLSEIVFEEIDRVEELLSNYRESSELSRINREAAAGPVTTDPETFQFLETAFAWSARSHGAFDMTVGKLMKQWGFFDGNGAVPRNAELREEQNQHGWDKVVLNRERRTVHFLSAGIELDPGGIGKGYAVDRAVKILRAHNVSTALLSAGSSTLYAIGAPPDEPGWKVRVPSPHAEGETISTVALKDTSLSTANRSEKFFVENEHLYGSIMDPRTLRPAEGVLQTTIIAPSATDSDALSNACFVLNINDREALLRQFPEVSALVVQASGPTYHTVRWNAAVEENSSN